MDAAVAATLSHLPLEATASEMGGTQVAGEETEDGAERRKWGARPSETVVNALQNIGTFHPFIITKLSTFVILIFIFNFLELKETMKSDVSDESVSMVTQETRTQIKSRTVVISNPNPGTFSVVACT